MKNSLHFRSKLLPRKYSSDFYLDDLANLNFTITVCILCSYLCYIFSLKKVT